MRTINAIALLLVVVGAVNWLLVGIAKFDLVAALTGTSFGQTNALSTVIYVLVGIAGLVLLGFRRRWWETLALATPIVLVTLVGAASLAAPRRNEILMTLIFPLAGLALSSAASALSSSRE